MARIRTFVAIDVGKGVKGRLSALMEALRREVSGARWVPTESMHLTLAFLGDIEDRDLHTVRKAVKAGCAGHVPFALRAEGVGCFPTPARPRVLWAGLSEGADELKALQASVDAALEQTGMYRPEDRPYSPHLTLARLKDAEGAAALLEKNAAWNGGEWQVGEVRVMSSNMSRHGPEYATLATVPLGG